MQNKNDKNYPNPSIDELNSTVSSTELTGLVQGLPEEDFRMGNYSEVCDVPEQSGLSVLERALDKVMIRQKKKRQ